jgi:MoxR-like ATPase
MAQRRPPLDEDRQAPAQRYHVDWGEASDGSPFYGREKELALLEEWIVAQGCRLIAVLGMGGLGKTSLALQLARQLQPSFDLIFWRSLLNAPPLRICWTRRLLFYLDRRRLTKRPV